VLAFGLRILRNGIRLIPNCFPELSIELVAGLPEWICAKTDAGGVNCSASSIKKTVMLLLRNVNEGQHDRYHQTERLLAEGL
jgi:hypothetical protein